MTRPATLCFALLTLFLSLHLTASVDPPADAPLPESPPPIHPPSDNSSPPFASPATPSPSPSWTPSPSAPDADAPPAADDDGAGTRTMNKSSGMSAGTKAGVAVGVIAFVVSAALGAFVLKKRKDNLARAQYGSAARRDML